MSLTTLQKIGFATSPLYAGIKGGQLMHEKLSEKWNEKTKGQKILSVLAPGLALGIDTAEIIKEEMAKKTTGQKILSIFSPAAAIATSVSNNQRTV